MNNEIKEILEALRDSIDDTGTDKVNFINWVDKIEDYITNLQQENERLKELCDKYEEEHSTAFNLWKMKMEEMPTYEEKDDYKSRIEKTIEYLDTLEIHEDYDNYLQPYYIMDKQNNVLDIDYLLMNIKNILKGRSDE